MDDILKSIKAFLYERTVSPLFGAFTLSWVIWNYSIIIIIFSGSGFENKLLAIHDYYSAVSLNLFKFNIAINGALVHSLFFPSVLTAIYLYVYPIIAEPVYEHHLKKQRKIREIKQEAEKERLLSKSESIEIFRQLNLLQDKHESETETYEQNIKSLKDTITILEEQLDEASTKETSNLKNMLDKITKDYSIAKNDISSKADIINNLTKHLQEHAASIEKLTTENTKLKNTKPIKDKKTFTLKIKDPDLTNDELEQLMQFGDLGGRYAVEALINESVFKQIAARNLLSTLENKGFVETVTDGDGGAMLKLTSAGTEKLLSLNEYSTRKNPKNFDDEIPF